MPLILQICTVPGLADIRTPMLIRIIIKDPKIISVLGARLSPFVTLAPLQDPQLASNDTVWKVVIRGVFYGAHVPVGNNLSLFFWWR
jgi:hypothetical protein